MPDINNKTAKLVKPTHPMAEELLPLILRKNRAAHPTSAIEEALSSRRYPQTIRDDLIER